MTKFISQTDFEFFSHINREIADDIIDVDVLLYKLSMEHTSTNIYGESTEKVSFEPVELPCVIDYPEMTTSTEDGFGIDKSQEVSFNFVRRILEERHVYPEVGDIIGYNNLLYEIDNVNDVQLIAGRPNYKHSVICNAHLTRKSALQIEPRQV